MNLTIFFKNILLKYKEYSIFQISTIFLFTFPLFSQKHQVFLIAFWTITAIYNLFKNNIKLSKKDITSILVLSSPYLLYILEFIFFDHKLIMGKYLETGAFFLISPLLIIPNKSSITIYVLRQVLKVYIFSISILNLLILTTIFRKGFYKLLRKDHFYNPVFRNIYSDFTGIHLPYLGLMFLFAVLISFYYITKNYKTINRIVLSIWVSNLALIIFSTFLFSARMAIGSACITTAYFILKSIKPLRYRVAIMSFGILLFIALFQLPPVKRRFSDIINTKFEMPNKTHTNKNENVNYRYGIYASSLQILKEKWKTGVGLGEVQNHLNEQYKKIEYSGYDDFTKIKYNTHNQYLEYLIAYGILGVFYLLFYIFHDWKNRNLLNKMFLLFISISLLTENIFSRQAGVIFFVIFNTILYIHKKDEKSISS